MHMVEHQIYRAQALTFGAERGMYIHTEEQSSCGIMKSEDLPMTINYNKTGEERKALVRNIEALTGIKAVYKKMPTQAYEIGPYTVSKTGALSFSDDTDAE